MDCKYPGYDWCQYHGSFGSCNAACISYRVCPGLQDEAEQADAHSCKANADSYGFCQVCGAIVRGSMADYDLHGYDPPEFYEDNYW